VSTVGVRRADLPLLVVSLLLTRTAALMIVVALPLIVIERYGGGPLIGLLLTLEWLPTLALAGVVGQHLERHNARRTAVVASTLTSAGVAVIPLTRDAGQLCLISLLIGVCYAFAGPARMTLRSLIIPAARSVRANAGLVAAMRVPIVLGPGAAALVAQLGTTVLFFVIAVLSVAAGSLLLLIRGGDLPAGVPGDAGADSPWYRRMIRTLVGDRDTVWEIFGRDRVVAALTISGVAYVGGLGVGRLFVVFFAQDHLPDGTAAFGYLLAALGAGGVLGGAVAARWNPADVTRWFVVASAIQGFVWPLILLHPAMWWAVAVMVVAGAIEGASSSFFYADVQLRLSPAVTGRYFALLVPLSEGALALGTTVGGMLAERSIVLAGAVTTAIMAMPVFLSFRWANSGSRLVWAGVR
jgi:MFS family permease